jgi:hypothetical protein
MATPQADLMSWLSDAHAMEMQAIQLLENQARRIETDPDLHDRIAKHMEETRGQVAKLEQCIENHGGTPSSLKNAGAMFTANMRAPGGAFMAPRGHQGQHRKLQVQAPGDCLYRFFDRCRHDRLLCALHRHLPPQQRPREIFPKVMPEPPVH